MRTRYYLRDKAGTKVVAEISDNDNIIKTTIFLEIEEGHTIEEVFKFAEWEIEYKEEIKDRKLSLIKK